VSLPVDIKLPLSLLLDLFDPLHGHQGLLHQLTVVPDGHIAALLKLESGVLAKHRLR